MDNKQMDHLLDTTGHGPELPCHELLAKFLKSNGLEEDFVSEYGGHRIWVEGNADTGSFEAVLSEYSEEQKQAVQVTETFTFEAQDESVERLWDVISISRGRLISHGPRFGPNTRLYDHWGLLPAYPNVGVPWESYTLSFWSRLVVPVGGITLPLIEQLASHNFEIARSIHTALVEMERNGGKMNLQGGTLDQPGLLAWVSAPVGTTFH